MYNYNQPWGMHDYSSFGANGAWVQSALPLWMAVLAPWIILIVLWSLVWKGLALWHAGRRGQPWWFIAMLILNTAGILEIIYLFGIAKLRFGQLFSSHDHRA